MTAVDGVDDVVNQILIPIPGLYLRPRGVFQGPPPCEQGWPEFYDLQHRIDQLSDAQVRYALKLLVYDTFGGRPALDPQVLQRVIASAETRADGAL